MSEGIRAIAHVCCLYFAI